MSNWCNPVSINLVETTTPQIVKKKFSFLVFDFELFRQKLIWGGNLQNLWLYTLTHEQKFDLTRFDTYSVCHALKIKKQRDYQVLGINVCFIERTGYYMYHVNVNDFTPEMDWISGRKGLSVVKV